MAGPQTRASVAVEIFVEQHVVAPVRIGLKNIRVAINGPPTIGITQKQANQTLCEIG